MRLIDADALKKEVDNFPNCYNGWSDTYDKAYIIGAIEEQPSIDIEPKRGAWKPFDLTWGRSIWYCTACEESTEVPCDIWTHKPIYKYCPNCGADMRGDNDGKDIQSADE